MTDEASPSIVTKVRDMLKLWDDGIVSRHELESMIREIGLDPFLKHMEAERDSAYVSMGSCCCSSHPPSRRFLVEIVIRSHGFTAVRRGAVETAESFPYPWDKEAKGKSNE